MPAPSTADGRTPPGAAADPLTEALALLRMDGVFYCRSELSGPWGLELPPMPESLWFHVVTTGRCVLIDSTGAEHPLRRGELAVLPHGVGHHILDAPDSGTRSIFDLEHDYVSPQYAVLRHGGGGDDVDLTCGVVRLGHPAARRLVAVLPEVIHVDPASGSGALEWLPALLGMMAAETRAPRAGSEAVVTRLCDVLVIQAIRSWIDTDPAAGQGWLGALRDPELGRAIAEVHRHPEHDWTVAALAAEAAMSRSAFSARFTELVGEPPMQYVTRWRMQVAIDLLRDEGLTVAAVAGRLGYASEAAFSRTFKRTVGESPGAVRRRGPTDLPVERVGVPFRASRGTGAV